MKSLINSFRLMDPPDQVDRIEDHYEALEPVRAVPATGPAHSYWYGDLMLVSASRAR